MNAIETSPNDNECPACARGEKTVTPPHSSIVGSAPVHRPSGNVCMKYLTPQVVEILANNRAPQPCPSNETTPSNSDTTPSHRA